MIELFSLIKQTKSIKIKCNNLSYWDADRSTDLIDYISANLEYFQVEVFNIEQGKIFGDTYIKSFDIELYMSDKIYEQIMDKFQGTIAKYNKDIVDISLYEFKFQE